MNTEKQRFSRPHRTCLLLEHLKIEPETFQFRDFVTDEVHVRDLSAALESGSELDRMTVWKRNEGDYVVVDGHHRHEAYSRVGYRKKIPVLLYECSADDAILLALNENTKTKLPMTKVERSNAAWRLVCGHPNVSKAETAKSTGVSARTVANMRHVQKSLERAGIAVPETWEGALAAHKSGNAREYTDEDRKSMIEAKAAQLDDQIGKALGFMASNQIEAACEVVAKRLGREGLRFLLEEHALELEVYPDDHLPF